MPASAPFPPEHTRTPFQVSASTSGQVLLILETATCELTPEQADRMGADLKFAANLARQKAGAR